MDIIHEKIDDFHIDIQKRRAYEMTCFHYHMCYELYVLLAGEMKITVQDKVCYGKAGDIFLVPAEHFHSVLCEKWSTRIVINFSEEFLSRLFSKSAISDMLRCFDLFRVSVGKETLSRIAELANDMLSEEDGSETTKLLRIAEILYTLSDKMNYDSPEREVTDSMKTASNILSYINDNYKTLSNIGEIADRFFLSKEYLCRLFKKYTGLTIISYLNGCKLKSAQQMLTETKKSIAEISEECGFSSPEYFSRIFKKNYYLSPADYRKVK